MGSTWGRLFVAVSVAVLAGCAAGGGTSGGDEQPDLSEVLVFDAPGAYVWTPTANNVVATILLIGGGGGGGSGGGASARAPGAAAGYSHSGGGGGGGASGVVFAQSGVGFQTGVTYSITVGDGGLLNTGGTGRQNIPGDPGGDGSSGGASAINSGRIALYQAAGGNGGIGGIPHHLQRHVCVAFCPRFSRFDSLQGA